VDKNYIKHTSYTDLYYNHNWLTRGHLPQQHRVMLTYNAKNAIIQSVVNKCLDMKQKSRCLSTYDIHTDGRGMANLNKLNPNHVLSTELVNLHICMHTHTHKCMHPHIYAIVTSLIDKTAFVKDASI